MMVKMTTILHKTKTQKSAKSRRLPNHGLWFLLPAIVVVGIFIAYPFFDSVWLSFQSYVLLGAPPHFIGLENYMNLIKSGALERSLKITAIFVLANTVVQVLGGFLFAFLLNTKGLWGQRFLRSTLLIPHTLTGVVASVLWLQIFSTHFGIANYALSLVHLPAQDWLLNHAMFVVVVASAWVGLGFAYLLFDAGLQGIPLELYDAAKVDGAGVWQQLRYVTIPGIRFMIFLVTILTSLASISGFAMIYVMTGGGPLGATDVLGIVMYKTAFSGLSFGLGAAAGVILLLANLIVTAVYIAVLKPKTFMEANAS